MIEMTKAEERALAATKLDAFPIQLHEVRRVVEQVLSLFGRNNFFSQYTVHDFSHVIAMLDDLEWIIPDDTKASMTPADWLLITLAIYFHDLGLVVTEEEFTNRDRSTFKDFCDKVLFAEDEGLDYKQKVDTLGSDQAERFFYQEFVRYNHAKRVRAWIEGTQSDELGFAKTQINEINELLHRVDGDFRQDLALICESHNLDDLEDLKKYKPFKPYGSRSDEAANLLYSAVLLRTADLLQITKQRAPSVMFRMINPNDPISQAEWAKQNAVKGVFPKPVLDKTGGTAGESETIAVYAKFDNENGFFGLTSYLTYAGKQLAYSHRCVQKANLQTTNKLRFPWKKIDDSEVEAVGFIPNPFEFQIDQTKILDLLTGHTLYNDSSVAVRELVQNSIDAVRLQCKQKELAPEEHGKISIIWNSDTLTLTILDNGTGMTQEIIERHLLNVGSSRYQDTKFKETFPDFSPISRFGIGVLSAFMVADNVQIATFHEDEPKGRQISLRSVHGKYLIRYLDKRTSDEAREIGPHGTKIVLKMRSTSKRVNVLRTLRRWVLFPRCTVTAQIDSEAPVEIGYASPKASLLAYIEQNPQLGFNPKLISIQERKFGDATLAFATRYNTHFRDFGFVALSDGMRRDLDTIPPAGVCVEGIRVEFNSPGFGGGGGVLAVVNCCGKEAPKTNVARSSLESDSEQAQLASRIFDAYLLQVQDEISRLQKDEGFSLSYAVDQFPYIAAPLYTGALDPKAQAEALRRFPMFMIEDDSGRRTASLLELIDMGAFWTVESSSMSSLVQLLQDAPVNVTCRQVVEFAQFKGAPLPQEALMTTARLNSGPRSLMQAEFEIGELKAFVADRRLDAKWVPLDPSKPRWIRSDEIEPRVMKDARDELRNFRRFREERSNRRRNAHIMVGRKEMPVGGLENYFGVAAMDHVWLLPETPIAKYLSSLDTDTNPEDMLRFLLLTDALALSIGFATTEAKLVRAELEYAVKEIGARFDDTASLIDVTDFLSAVANTEGRLIVFNPWSWRRAANEGG